MSSRNGTDVDAAAAIKTFSQLGYKINVASNLTVTQMKSRISSGNRLDSLKCHSNKHQQGAVDMVAVVCKPSRTCWLGPHFLFADANL